ncbi:MAG: hypothetical protein MUO72_19465 [Bacteroidales bacterium]|nr:hypothetical protein [Bacteroidales bacterium]
MGKPDDIGGLCSSIHITRNNFVLQGIELGAHINDIVAGAMPSALACDFMHESTHHWCYSFQVGYAMAILRHRARLALMANPNHDAQIKKMLNEEVLLRCTRAALDPLAEGLSMFAELDVCPGPFTSQPILNWLTCIFLRKEIEQQRSAIENDAAGAAGALDAAVMRLLNTCREGNAARRVREKLLSQPLALKGRGHYLLGYMLVKRIARRLRREVGLLAESGLVLEWIMRFFFDDAQLIHMLLSDKHVDNINKIITRIEARINALFGDDAIDWFRTFARHRA